MIHRVVGFRGLLIRVKWRVVIAWGPSATLRLGKVKRLAGLDMANVVGAQFPSWTSFCGSSSTRGEPSYALRVDVGKASLLQI